MSTFYVSDQDISERADLLLKLANELLDSGPIPKNKVALAEHRIRLISEGYFILNRIFKEWRLPDGHRTERPKIAALQCVVISRLQPFFPLDVPVDEANIGITKCNVIFGFTYALGILEKKFTPDTDEKVDFWLRVLDVISTSSAETIEPYITDRKYQIIRPLEEYTPPTASVNRRDKPAINALISIFELISDKGKFLLG